MVCLHNNPESENNHMLYLIALILLAAPFYLNDFANIFVKSWQCWLFIDYVGVKLFPFLVVLWLIRSGRMAPSEFGFSPQSALSFLAVFVMAALVGTLIDQNGYRLIEHFPEWKALGGMPSITSSLWDWIDLTFGLFMVGIFEEIVFRAYMHRFLGRYTRNPLVIVLISALAFGLIHWSLGLHAMVITALIGAVFMIAYIGTRSIPAIICAHFAVNFIDFAGVIPESLFQLL